MTPNTLLIIAAVILVLPLLSFAVNVFWGKRMGRASGVIGTSIIGIDLLLSIYVLYSKLTVFAQDTIIQIKIPWIDLQKSTLNVGIGIDNLAAAMLIVVTLISFLVHLFSTEYMAGDKRYSRYFAYLGLFSFSMLGIVIANNFAFMYIFWELVGISSYLLIGFWYEKDSASNAGKKAFIVNRIGDLGFLIGILISFYTYGTFMFDEIFGGIAQGIMPFDSGTWLGIAGILIFCGAIGKSAQFPLHVWLPDAMEGPTPVSALIHAATMVAAGVYMVARVFPMLTADALTFIAFIGAITAFMSATIALTQVDFKRVLAYSTVSQLGFMIMSLGVGSWMTGFFHLVTHAWFKAALFLASGSVIHAMHHSAHHFNDHHTDPQDIRNMGGLRRTMPWTYYTFLMVTLAISGVPLTSGFLSKDGILAGTLAFAQLTGGIYWLIPIMGFSAAGMTAFYMFRLLIRSFHGEHNTKIAEHTKENKWVIVFPLVLLSVLSLWFFYSPNPIDAHAGWFAKALVAPKTVVPAEYQWSFLMPKDAMQKKGMHGCCDKFHNEPCSKECMDSCDKMMKECCGESYQEMCKKIGKDSCDKMMKEHCDKSSYEMCCKMDKNSCDKMMKECCGESYQEMCKKIGKDSCDKMMKEHCEKSHPGMCMKMSNDSCHKLMNECCDSTAGHHAGIAGDENNNPHSGTNINDEQKTTHEAGSHGESHYANFFEEQMHHAHIPAMILSLLIAGCGILFSFMVYQFKIFSADKMAEQFKPLYKFSFNKWYFDEFYQATVINGTVGLSKVLALFDLKIIDGLVNWSAGLMRIISYFIGHFDNIVVDGLVNLVASITGLFGAIFRKVQTGSVQTYLIFAIIGMMVLIYYFL
jgi:NADH-quinone oxidoreductase subunit L